MPRPAEPVEDVHPEESILEVLLLGKPDPGPCHHAAVSRTKKSRSFS
jgi:hypothetical protein